MSNQIKISQIILYLLPYFPGLRPVVALGQVRAGNQPSTGFHNHGERGLATRVFSFHIKDTIETLCYGPFPWLWKLREDSYPALVLVWCVKDRPGHLGQLAPLLLLLLPHYPQYQSIQLLSKYFLPVSHKYFLSVNISLCDGWLCRWLAPVYPLLACRHPLQWKCAENCAAEARPSVSYIGDTNPALCLPFTILYIHNTHLIWGWMER